MRQRDDHVFPLSEYQRRLSELHRRMIERDIEVLLTTTPENICYLTGFESPGHYYFFGLLVPLEGEPVTISRVLEDSGVEELTWIEVRRPYAVYENPMERVHATLEEFSWLNKRIGYEKGCWFFTALQQDDLKSRCPGTDFVDCTGIVETGRLTKSSYEIELMKKAAIATEAGMQAGIDAISAGVSENDVAAEIHHAMIKTGGEWTAIAPFVASGYRGAVGHATWMQRIIQPDEFVFLEIGGCRRRYHTAMMRTVFVGQPPNDVLSAMQVVLDSMQAMLEAIKPGIAAGEVDAAARKVTESSHLDAQQAWLAGYSIGIALPPDWGEGHILRITPGGTQLLQENMTFHLIPWVQLPGRGGLSCSATVRVTSNGVELLTNFPQKLFIK